jgi:hypothetical protein
VKEDRNERKVEFVYRKRLTCVPNFFPKLKGKIVLYILLIIPASMAEVSPCECPSGRLLVRRLGHPSPLVLTFDDLLYLAELVGHDSLIPCAHRGWGPSVMSSPPCRCWLMVLSCAGCLSLTLAV